MNNKRVAEIYAKKLNLYILSWSPGDGATRYKVTSKPGVDYWGLGDDDYFYAVGVKELMLMLRAITWDRRESRG
jgi:hypothetical protein